MRKLMSLILLSFVILISLLYIYSEEYTNGGVERVFNTLKIDFMNIRDNSVLEANKLLSSEDNSKKEHFKLTEPRNQTFSVSNIEIKDTKAHVLDTLGKEKRIVKNEYGYEWYIFHDEYQNFAMISFDEKNYVNGLFTNHDLIGSKNDIKLGTNKESIKEIYGEPLASIKKGNVNHLINQDEDFLIYKIEHNYITFFFDSMEEDELQAVQIIHEDMEKEKSTNYGTPSKDLQESFEKTLFDLTNATRTKFELKTLKWDERSYETAYNHSADMAEHNYFSHENLQNQTPFDRLTEDGVKYHFAGENLAMGQSSSIFAHLGLLNSPGHRQNILKNDYEEMSVGVSFNNNNQPFYTEIYITE